MTDSGVIEAIRRGDREAFAILVERYQRMVEAVAYAACGRRELLDDIVQDTFITAWRTIDRLRDPARVRAWLTAIGRNIARNARRRCNTRREELLVEVEATAEPFGHEREREIAAALARLPDRYREPIVLFYYEQCTVKEVAEALALREDAVMQRLSRGRRRLGEELATDVEISLERKRSRSALAACLLLLLPVRSAAAAPAASPVLAWLAAQWRIPAAVLASAAALLGLAGATQRSEAIAAKQAARESPEQPQTPLSKPPALPERDDDGSLHRNIVVASPTAAESCARAAGALAIFALDKDPYRRDGKYTYFEPSEAAVRQAEIVAANAAAECGTERWPEIYVVCEATLFDIIDGKANCYPYDPFAGDAEVDRDVATSPIPEVIVTMKQPP